MGSAFSVFLQRCWAVFRELYFSRTIDTVTLRTPGSRVAWVLVSGVWAAILEMRYADDISQTIVAPVGTLSTEALRKILLARRTARYQKINGLGVTLEQGKVNVFIGLGKILDLEKGVLVRPMPVSLTPFDLPHEAEQTSCITHNAGWRPPGFTTTL
jgi:hypothetical protein